MKPICEIDVVRLLEAVNAAVLGGDNRNVVIPKGTIGTVVIVHEVGGKPAAYEVEFYLDSDEYAIATVETNQLVLVE